MSRFLTISRSLLVAVGVLAAVAVSWATETAAQPPAVGDAIRWAPADVAVCGAVLRVREQLEAAAETRAWDRLTAMPVWRQVSEVWNLPLTRVAREVLYAKLTEPGKPGAQLDVLLNDPQLQRLAAMGVDMLDEEFVWYADANTIDLLRVMAPTGNVPALNGLLASDRLDSEAVRRAAVRQMAESLAGSLVAREAPLPAPSVVWAFRLSDTGRAAEQLGKFELLASLVCWTNPELRGRLSRHTVAEDSYITFKLEGRMAAPWVAQRLAELEVDPDAVKQILDALGELPFVVALGMRQDYLVLAVGPSLEAIETMLHGDNRLIDRPEMAPLQAALQQRLTGLAYASPELAAAMREAILPATDASAGDDLGPILAYSIWTERGIEQFTWDWPAGKDWANAEPLRLLPYAGEHPLILATWQCRMDREELTAWADRMAQSAGRFDAWLRPQLSGAALRYYRVGVALWRPFGRRGGEAIRNMVFPLLEHGQGMVVVDARRDQAEQLAVRPALVLDLSRAEQFHATCDELEQMITEIRDALADRPAALPAAAESETDRKRVCHLGDDRAGAFAPSLGLSRRVAVLTLSPGHARELLEARTSTPAFLADEPGELLSLAHFDWSALVELSRPAGHQAAEAVTDWIVQIDGAALSSGQRQSLHAQLDTLFDLLQVVRTISCRRYLVDGALVTHRIAELRDVQ